MPILISIFLLLSMLGCGFVTINIVQRTITDVGDNTKDDYVQHDNKKEEDSMKLVVPIK